MDQPIKDENEPPTNQQMAKKQKLNDDNRILANYIGFETYTISVPDDINHYMISETEDDVRRFLSVQDTDGANNDVRQVSKYPSRETPSVSSQNDVTMKKIVTAADAGNNKNLLSKKYICSIMKVHLNHKCMICLKDKSVKYTSSCENQTFFVCSDACLKVLSQLHMVTFSNENSNPIDYSKATDVKQFFVRNCKQCGKDLNGKEGICSWQETEFCEESCLWRHQKTLSKCAKCKRKITFQQLGKYAVRLGSIVRQYCGAACLETIKKEISICLYCQKISPKSSAPPNEMYCDTVCKTRYKSLQKPFVFVPGGKRCFICNTKSFANIEYHHSSQTTYHFCSTNCFTTYQVTSNRGPAPIRCYTCSGFVFGEFLKDYLLFKSKGYYHFCSRICRDICIIRERKIVDCAWCKVKKNNFDMIQKSDLIDNALMFCSIYCMRHFDVSLRHVEAKVYCIVCGLTGQYSAKCNNGTRKVFCSKKCMQRYQLQSKVQLGDTKDIGSQLKMDKILTLIAPLLPKQKNVAVNTFPTTVDKEVQTSPIDTSDAETQTSSVYLPQGKPCTLSVSLDKNTASDIIDILESTSSLFPCDK